MRGKPSHWLFLLKAKHPQPHELSLSIYRPCQRGLLRTLTKNWEHQAYSQLAAADELVRLHIIPAPKKTRDPEAHAFSPIPLLARGCHVGNLPDLYLADRRYSSDRASCVGTFKSGCHKEDWRSLPKGVIFNTKVTYGNHICA